MEGSVKITVKSVEDDSFDGKDGRVLAAKLTFSDGNGEKTLPTYGPKSREILVWKPGEEREIETYTTGGGKPAFRLGGASAAKRGGFEAAFRNTKEGQAAEQERMDRRTALMKAAEVVCEGIKRGDHVKDGRHIDTDTWTKGIADSYYDWLRKTAQ
jgi:hypothetical protein